ncbi:uncharacterized protein K452DRAFT_302854 [Aplosporella prunicola CBS 121167]|uniref:Hydantoinase/oxoprolinase N-terminal domain-containing protein n=1 Tax=Aplosporella prunicola CBS 121167 TaxID=1176127 RepID=A0A6A6AZD2_9PEZI|nr:uncharacterized protein K452DRAFT_302854 [Aplosporella prunicola CBS 121167]KAF2136315.1 hypothetical protein K452DRAFT_302854 [Aplosporella prunicola CBS 121167]
MPKMLRIGVDVGGTNTDGVILDPSRTAEPDRGIVAWHKAPTTTNPSLGINHALTSMFEQSNVSPDDVASVTIGTTHFVNAVIERDATRLAKVAVLRLSGPFGKHALPCTDWPDDLRSLILGYYALARGGLEISGQEIDPIDPAEIRAFCAAVREKGIRSIVVNGVFSPLDTVFKQEESAAAIMRAGLPGVDIVLAHEVAQIGFLERENAAVLNASIMAFARRTIRAFSAPMQKLGLRCPVFVAQNDGTVLAGSAAAKLPIRTFSSGPTNSMRGAAFLVRDVLREAALVVDVGGTTTDVGALLPSGFPRQAAAFSEVAGVRTNFSCPDVKSIGLGGGSVVREDGERVTVGPDSVGYRIKSEALVFGGEVPTATDYTVAGDAGLQIGDRAAAEKVVTKGSVKGFRETVRRMLERIIDTMKTSPEDLPVLLVGGGAIIAPEELKGASKVLKPEYAGVANAIGAAIARVSAVVDTVKSTEKKSTKELLEEISNDAIERAVKAGAARESVEIVEMETLPLQYIANKSRFIVRAAGDFDFTRVNEADTLPAAEEEDDNDNEATGQQAPYEKKPAAPQQSSKDEPIDIASYRPKVIDRIWYISETDLAWITTGCYILGTGGGGSPYSNMLRLRSMLRARDVIRVISPSDLTDTDLVGCGGGAGSPTVGIEKLAGDEMTESQAVLSTLTNAKPTALISLEVGGSNGLQSLILGATSNMDLPAVDGDWMGRAYPTMWQTTPVVAGERDTVWLPAVMCDGNGNSVAMLKSRSDETTERVFRAGLAELGSHVGCALAPVTGAETRRWAVPHTLSQSWRIGRAVHAARQTNRLAHVADAVVDAVGGRGVASVLFRGKIVGVSRVLRNGHVYGEVEIAGMDDGGEGGGAGAGVGAGEEEEEVREGWKERYATRVKIPFKNENIAVLAIEPGGVETPLATVPDLIAVIDAQSGEAVGSPEYRYGVLVAVVGIAAGEQWTGTARGVELGGLHAFGMHDVRWTPLGRREDGVRGVVDEFAT